MLIYEVTDAFEKAKLKYAIVGGYAMALHGVVRATMDVDLVLRLSAADYTKAEQILNSLGLKSRLPLKASELISMRKEYIEKRNLIAWSFVDFSDPTRIVDIIITSSLEDFKSIKVSVGGRKLSVISIEDLLNMKLASGRPQDLVDVASIKEKLHGKKS